MPCEEQQRLRAFYQARVLAHGTAVNDQAVTRGKTSKQEFDRLCAATEKARTNLAASRLALQRHIQEHGC
jgi:hypothetical protein